MALLAASYYAAGKLGLLLAIPPGYATGIWPPAGIALGVILARGTRLWPGILAGSLLLNLEISLRQAAGGPLAAAGVPLFGIAMGATVQALLSAALVRRFVSQPLELAREVDIFRFFVLGGAVGSLINATWSVLLLALARAVAWPAVPFTWLTWWIGDTVGVILIAPLVLAWMAEPRAMWKRRLFTVNLPVLLMVAVVVALFVRVSGLEQARLKTTFDIQAAGIGHAVHQKLQDTLEIIRTVDDLYEAEPNVDDRGFRSFVARLLSRHQGIQAVSWDPWITAAERAGFERAAGGSPIVEKAADGRMVPAGAREGYLPIHVIEPLEGNRRALGFDVLSEPVRRASLERARDTGAVAATRRVALVQEDTGAPAILVYYPRYRRGAPTSTVDERRRALAGFVAGAIRLDDLMASALAGLERKGVELDLRERDGAFPLWSDAVSVRGPGTLASARTVDVADASWTLAVSAGPEYPARAGAWGAWVVLTGGLVFTGLLGAFLLSASGRAVLIERLGAERAGDLSRMNATLEKEIAERKAAEASLFRKEGELLQAQKMEAIGRLAGGVAHDFNNLLTAILGYTHLLLVREAAPFPNRADLDEIRKASERAAQLTAQLLAFSRKQVLKPVVLDVSAVVADMNKMLRRIIGEDIDLVTAFPKDVGRAKVDRGQIEQVILNMALNARDAMAKGGKLRIETRNVTTDEGTGGLPAPPSLPPGRYVTISVSDTGTGMDEATLSHLFEPFFTTKEQGKGTGLGLSTAYGIISQSGGHIGVRSGVGAGSTFTIYLPRVEEMLSDSRLKALPEEAGSGTETLLLVEDEDVVRRLSSVVLRQKGYTVLEAVNGEDAVRLLSQHEGPIDLLITDMIMPRMGGRELAHQVSLLRPDIKVLFISGYAETAIVHHGLLGPNTFFLAKPFTPLTLARKVREILESLAERPS
jgi:signal transduction histidine kinase